MRADNILTIVDVSIARLNPLTVDYLETHHVTYRDQVCKEHIININDALEEVDMDESEFLSEVSTEIRQLQKLAEDNDSGYIRIIKN